VRRRTDANNVERSVNYRSIEKSGHPELDDAAATASGLVAAGFSSAGIVCKAHQDQDGGWVPFAYFFLLTKADEAVARGSGLMKEVDQVFIDTMAKVPGRAWRGVKVSTKWTSVEAVVTEGFEGGILGEVLHRFADARTREVRVRRPTWSGTTPVTIELTIDGQYKTWTLTLSDLQSAYMGWIAYPSLGKKFTAVAGIHGVKQWRIASRRESAEWVIKRDQRAEPNV